MQVWREERVLKQAEQRHLQAGVPPLAAGMSTNITASVSHKDALCVNICLERAELGRGSKRWLQEPTLVFSFRLMKLTGGTLNTLVEAPL